MGIVRSIVQPIVQPIVRDLDDFWLFDEFLYSKIGLAGFWTDEAITQDSVEAVDYTSNANNMALNTGRAVSMGGVSDYFTIKYPGTPVAKIRVLARSATDGLVLAHPTEDAGTLAIEFLNITPNNLWQYTESIVRDYTTFPPTGGVIESDIVIGRDSSAISYFAGEIALVELIDGDDNVIDTIYLNGHEDAAGAGLGGKLVVSVNGNVGEYTGCSSVNSLPAPVPQLAGMNYNLTSSEAYAVELTVKTDNAGTSNDDQVTLNFSSSGYFDCVISLMPRL